MYVSSFFLFNSFFNAQRTWWLHLSVAVNRILYEIHTLKNQMVYFATTVCNEQQFIENVCTIIQLHKSDEIYGILNNGYFAWKTISNIQCLKQTKMCYTQKFATHKHRNRSEKVIKIPECCNNFFTVLKFLHHFCNETKPLHWDRHIWSILASTGMGSASKVLIQTDFQIPFDSSMLPCF